PAEAGPGANGALITWLAVTMMLACAARPGSGAPSNGGRPIGGDAAPMLRGPFGRFEGMPIRRFLDRVRSGQRKVLLRERRKLMVVPSKDLEVLLREILHIDQAVAGAAQRRHDLVQLQFESAGLLVLAALDEEDHQECDDRRPGVDDELPRVREG